MPVAWTNCSRRDYGMCRCPLIRTVRPALKVTEVETRRKRKPITVARPQVLPNEALLDVLCCVDRRTLDNVCLIRRFSPLLAHCDQLRVVYQAFLSYNPSTYLYSGGFAVRVMTKQHLRRGSPRETWLTKEHLANTVSVNTKSLRRATDVFANALLHSRVIGKLRLENVELNGYFVRQLKSIANRYVMDGESLAFDGVSLRVNVNLVDFICSFSSIKSLSYSAGRWLDTIGLDDATLDSLASNGMLDLSPRGSYFCWNCRHLSEDALLAFAFGDSYANDRLRRFSGRECQLSEAFILKLVRARRESQGNHRLFLKVEMAEKLLVADVELSIDDLRQHGQYDDDRGVWRFTFADVPNFRIEYDDIMELVRCWSNVSGDNSY